MAALFIISKRWKQPKCPSAEWIVKVNITMGYYLAVKRNEALIYAVPWMNLENIMLSESD